MKRALAIWLGASAVGVALIVLLPESWLGEGRLFSLSEGHGPSASDAVGLALAIGGWVAYLRALWSHRGDFAPRHAAMLLVAIAAVATAACLAAVANDSDRWALGLGLVAVAGQMALAFMTRKEA